MQYILSQDEYDELLSKRDIKFNITKKQLQTLCTTIADTMPIKLNWGPWKEAPLPWGCILTVDQEWYCDSCPVKKICPNEHKESSK